MVLKKIMGRNIVKYGARSFAQDASNAMKGEIVGGSSNSSPTLMTPTNLVKMERF